MYYDTATGKVVTGIHVAGPVGAKMIGWVIKSQSFNNPIDNDQVSNLGVLCILDLCLS